MHYISIHCFLYVLTSFRFIPQIIITIPRLGSLLKFIPGIYRALGLIPNTAQPPVTPRYRLDAPEYCMGTQNKVKFLIVFTSAEKYYLFQDHFISFFILFYLQFILLKIKWEENLNVLEFMTFIRYLNQWLHCLQLAVVSGLEM